MTKGTEITYKPKNDWVYKFLDSFVQEDVSHKGKSVFLLSLFIYGTLLIGIGFILSINPVGRYATLLDPTETFTFVAFLILCPIQWYFYYTQPKNILDFIRELHYTNILKSDFSTFSKTYTEISTAIDQRWIFITSFFIVVPIYSLYYINLMVQEKPFGVLPGFEHIYWSYFGLYHWGVFFPLVTLVGFMFACTILRILVFMKSLLNGIDYKKLDLEKVSFYERDLTRILGMKIIKIGIGPLIINSWIVLLNIWPFITGRANYYLVFVIFGYCVFAFFIPICLFGPAFALSLLFKKKKNEILSNLLKTLMIQDFGRGVNWSQYNANVLSIYGFMNQNLKIWLLSGTTIFKSLALTVFPTIVIPIIEIINVFY